MQEKSSVERMGKIFETVTEGMDDKRAVAESFGVFGIERPELNGASTVAPIEATDTRADQ